MLKSMRKILTAYNTRVLQKKHLAHITRVLQKNHLESLQEKTKLYLPRPDDLNRDINISGMRVLLLCNALNGLSKRVKLHLENAGVRVKSVEVTSEAHIENVTKEEVYDIIVCPFLTKRIPRSVWSHSEKPCLVVHPGIAGDRGASSLDWAIHDNMPIWGVTVLEADEEMDAGNIWSTSNFLLHDESLSKTTLYNSKVSDAAVETVMDALKRFKMNVPSTPLDYKMPGVIGTLRPTMLRAERKVSWDMPAEEIVKNIRMSDTRPGTKAWLPQLEKEVVIFGGHIQPLSDLSSHYTMAKESTPGTILAKKDGGLLIKAGDENCVWVTHMKKSAKKTSLKLPAEYILGSELRATIPAFVDTSAWNEITANKYLNGKIAVINFDFYNGAMSTEQCHRLEKNIKNVAKDPEIKVVILLGGKMFFSTGIHLNVIGAADNPAKESWDNINAINDAIKALFSIEDKITISALQSGAGAGGVMMAAAADFVWARKGLVLTPSYKAMSLFGSEYWTYFLPKRVGEQNAEILTESGESILSEQAEAIGLVDKTFKGTRPEFIEKVMEEASFLLDSDMYKKIVASKKSMRTEDWYRTVENHREKELEKMAKNFSSEEYKNARDAFLYG